MTVLAIELNDAGLIAASSSLIGEAQPGCARYDDEGIETGQAARNVGRLLPHQIEQAFWHQLSLDPMTRTTATAHTYADLAHAQLSELHEPHQGATERVVIAVPSSFSPKQLGLLLGICQRAKIPVTGIADAAVAAVTHPVPGTRMLHVDATNHCVLITELLVDKGLHRGEVFRIDNIGLLDFTSRWASALGDMFVKQTRFDPFHSAKAEQHLYDQIPGVIASWQSGVENVAVSSEDSQHEADVQTADLAAAVAGLYQPMVNAIHTQTDSQGVTTVMLSHRVAQLPGFEASVADHDGVRVVTLDEQAVTRSILQHPEYFESPEGKFALVKSKPWQETPSIVPDAEPQSTGGSARDLATHVLIGDALYPLGEEPFVIGTSPASVRHAYQVTGIVKGISRQHCTLTRKSGQIVLDDMSTFGTKINGKRATPSQPVRVGDRVSLGNPGIEVRLVREVITDG